MTKIYLYAAVAVVAVSVLIGTFMAGSHSGKLSVAHKLDKLEIKRQKEVTALTLKVTGKQKEISDQRHKNQEIIKNAKVDNCADMPLPTVFSQLLRVSESP